MRNYKNNTEETDLEKMVKQNHQKDNGHKTI